MTPLKRYYPLDPAEDEHLVRFLLASSERIDTMLADHVSDGAPRPHCRACAGAITGRSVWPCDLYWAADRADGIRRRRQRSAGTPGIS